MVNVYSPFLEVVSTLRGWWWCGGRGGGVDSSPTTITIYTQGDQRRCDQIKRQCLPRVFVKLTEWCPINVMSKSSITNRILRVSSIYSTCNQRVFYV